MNDLKHCYKELGIQPGASLDEVKRAYRDMATVWHPDRFANNPRLQEKAQEQLKAINNAYHAISEELTRYAPAEHTSQEAEQKKRAEEERRQREREAQERSRQETERKQREETARREEAERRRAEAMAQEARESEPKTARPAKNKRSLRPVVSGKMPGEKAHETAWPAKQWSSTPPRPRFQTYSQLLFLVGVLLLILPVSLDLKIPGPIILTVSGLPVLVSFGLLVLSFRG